MGGSRGSQKGHEKDHAVKRTQMSQGLFHWSNGTRDVRTFLKRLLYEEGSYVLNDINVPSPR